MAYPNSYSRRFGFQGFQDTHPTTPLPGDSLDAELAAVGQSAADIVAFIRKFARSDGKLANNSVGVDQLAADLSIGFKAPTTWETGIRYLVGDTVFYGNKFYNCEVEHTAGDTFAAEYWTVIVDFGAQATAAAASAADAAVSAAAAGAAGNVVGAALFGRGPVLSVITALPGTPSNGERYLVAHSGTSGALAGKEDQVVERVDGVWVYSGMPTAGVQIHVQSVGALYRYGAAWSRVLQIHAGDSTSLSSADTLAAAIGAELVVDGGFSLPANFTATAKQVRFGGGQIVTGTYTADFSGSNIIGPVAPLFDVSGGGLVKFAKGQHIQDAWFGVAPDGSSDDAPALATLYTQLASSPNCTVHHQSGVRYRLESTKIRIPTGTKVAGNGAIFEIRNGYFARGILIDGVTDVRVEDLNVEMKATTALSQYYGIAIQNSSRVHLLRCKVSDPSWSDSTDNASVAVLMYGFLCGQSTTESLASGTYAGDGSDDTACDDITAEDCLADGCYQYAYEFFPKRISERHTLINCGARNVGNSNSESLAPAGFKIGQLVNNCRVINCWAEDCWYGLIPAVYNSLDVQNIQIKNPRRQGIATTFQEHSYFDPATGGNDGNGYYTGDGTGPYTYERLRIADSAIFHTEDKKSDGSSPQSAVNINGSVARNGLVLFENLNIDVATGWNGYTTDSDLTAAIPNVKIIGGYCKAKVPAILTNSGTGGAVLDKPRVRGVEFETNDTTAASRYVMVMGTGAEVSYCTFRGMTTYGLWMKGAGSRAFKNVFIDLNPGSVDTTYAILFNDTTNTYTAFDNAVIGGNVAAVLQGSGSGISIKQWLNSADSNIPIFASSDANGVDGQMVSLGGAGGGSRLFTGTAAPVAGAYRQGDIVLNRNITAGGVFGWECTTSGSPGTWNTIVSVAA